jgi:hypothetical protein
MAMMFRNLVNLSLMVLRQKFCDLECILHRFLHLHINLLLLNPMVYHVLCPLNLQRYKPQKVSSKRKKINKFIIDETQIKVGSQYIWQWVAIEPKHKQILQIDTPPLNEICLLQNALYPL